MSLEIGEFMFCEDLGNKTGPQVSLDLVVVAHSNAAALLTTVLQSEETEERKAGYVCLAGVDSEYSTFLVHHGLSQAVQPGRRGYPSSDSAPSHG